MSEPASTKRDARRAGATNLMGGQVMDYDYQPLILIGAARSGTKLLRDLIATHPSVDKVPYDINFIWRLGNERLPHDELPVKQLTPQVRERILRGIDRSRLSDAPYLVEKTVGNCLRVPFVRAVFPDARFIHLIRDGRDVVESVYRQWNAPPDWHYILDKAKSFPLTEAFGYALSYAKGLCLKFILPNNHRATWGQRYVGIDEDLAALDLLEVCAIQWARSVEKALEDLNALPSEGVLTIRYEDFVREPIEHLGIVSTFIGISSTPYRQTVKVAAISQQNIGKGVRNLRPDQAALIMPRISRTLAMLGYE